MDECEMPKNMAHNNSSTPYIHAYIHMKCPKTWLIIAVPRHTCMNKTYLWSCIDA
jgi:hypothetical protein